MRPYLCRSPVMAVAVPDRAQPAPPPPDQPFPWARPVLDAHVSGVDGWCAACLAAGSCFLWPCPEVTTVLRLLSEQSPAGTLGQDATA